MSSPQTKADLLAAFETARRAHLAFLAGIPRERMTEPGVTGPWSWIYAQHRAEPLDAVLARWDRSFDRIAALVATLPEDALFDPDRFPWMEGAPLAGAMAGGFLGHFQEEHEPALRAWLAAPG